MTIALPQNVAPAVQPALASVRRHPVWQWVSLGVLLIGYILFLHARSATAISEPDDNGYFAQGTLLAQTGRTWFIPASDAQYIGMHWLVTPAGHYISRYPPGLAVIIAAVDRVAGWRATLAVNPALSVLALVGFFLLARRVATAGWALVGTALLAMNPTFVHHALSGDSHMGVACAFAWHLYFLIRWGTERKKWLAFAAGIAIGCVPTVRYPDVVLGLGTAVYLLWHWRAFARIGWHYAVFILGAAVPIVPLMIRNQLLLGGFWRTGYALTHEQTGFSWAYFQAHAIDYLREINGDAIGVLFALGFLGMVCMMISGSKGRRNALGLMLFLQATAMLLLYMAYYWAPQMNADATLRFLLPIYIPLVLAGVWLLRELSAPLTGGRQIAMGAAVLALQLLWGTSELLTKSSQLQYQKRALATVTTGIEAVAHRGDVVIATGNLAQQLDFVREWKIADGSLVRGGGNFPGGGGMGGPGMGGGRGGDGPSPMQAEKVEEQRQKYPGSTEEREDKFAADVRLWAGPMHAIYIVGNEQTVQSWEGVAGGHVAIVSHVKLPAAPAGGTPAGRGQGGFMRGGGMGGPGGGPGGGFGFRNGGGRGGMGGGMGGFAGETEQVIARLELPH